MKWILPAVLGLILPPAGLVAQSAARGTGQQTADSQPLTPSDQDKNIRSYIELLRSDIRNQRTQIMSTVMQLDAQQSTVFWPIYKDFEADYTQIGQGIVDLVKNYVKNYENMTAPIADQLGTKLLNLEQQRTELKRRYFDRFKTALDPITATRFLQVENQLEKILDLQIASQLPVIAGPQGSQP